MDGSRAAMYAALLMAVLATVSTAPQFLDDGNFNRFPPGSVRGPPPVFYDDEDESSDENELTFFQRLVRPWRWFDPVFDFFSGDSNDDEELYDEESFPSRFPGQQVARLDQRPALRPAAERPQRYLARPPLQEQHQFAAAARSSSAANQQAQRPVGAAQEEPAQDGSPS